MTDTTETSTGGHEKEFNVSKIRKGSLKLK